MKLSKVAAAVAALLATDAKPTEAQIMAACLAADKKGKDDNSGLGPKEIEKTDKAKDAFPDKDDDKAKDEKDDKAEDEKDDPEGTNAKDEEVDGMDDVKPAKSASGNSGAGGAEPAKDKKGMDTKAIVAAALAADRALTAACREVEPVLGVVTYDTAAEVYGAALAKLGVDTTGVHPSAFGPMFKLARDKADAQTPTLAADAARVNGMTGVIKGYDRLK